MGLFAGLFEKSTKRSVVSSNNNAHPQTPKTLEKTLQSLLKKASTPQTSTTTKTKTAKHTRIFYSEKSIFTCQAFIEKKKVQDHNNKEYPVA
jgi:hypothetical protein